MKILKALLFLVLGLLAIGLLAGLFIKKDYKVERSIVINKPKTLVFETLKSLKGQNEWSAWGRKDPNMKSEFIGTDGTVGCISKWSGNEDVGSGEQEIKKIVEGERIDNELRFKEPMEDVSQAYFITEASDTVSTKVTWGLTWRMDYPMNVMTVFMDMDKMIGKDLNDGLSNLKAKLEQ